MSTATAPRYVCVESKTQLHTYADDGARCGNAMHWHRRLSSGYAGARPAPSVRYTDVDPPEPTPLAAGSSEGDI